MTFMAIKQYITENNQIVKIDDQKKLGRAGGEGCVYHISDYNGNAQDYCAKIYLDHILNNASALKMREQKIRYMVNHPILLNHSAIRICSPIAMLFEKGSRKFVGFVMLKAFDHSEQLTWLTSGGYDLTGRKIHSRFEAFSGEKHLEALYNRLVVANNLAYAIAQLHQTGHYVLVDMKPENILITPSGAVSVIDTDSVQIVDSKGKLIFKSSVWSEYYKPPEGYDGRIVFGSNTIITPYWDSFSFGIIAYEMIIGAHPYTGTYNPPFDKGTDIMSNIMNGLFLHGSKQAYLSNPTSLQEVFGRWNALPAKLRDTFYRTFEKGQATPNQRPLMPEWGIALTEAIKQLQPIMQQQKVPKSSNSPITQTRSQTQTQGQTQLGQQSIFGPNNQPKRSYFWPLSIIIMLILLFILGSI